jgi:hypothetical protein
VAIKSDASLKANIHAVFQGIALEMSIHVAVWGDYVLESACLAKLKRCGLVLRARLVLPSCFLVRATAMRVNSVLFLFAVSAQPWLRPVSAGLAVIIAHRTVEVKLDV